MVERFGRRIIKIADLSAFAAEVAHEVGATRFYFNRVIYNDLKMFCVRTLKSFDVVRAGATNGNFGPQVITEGIFDFLLNCSFLPSLFIKPTRFAIEEELKTCL